MLLFIGSYIQLGASRTCGKCGSARYRLCQGLHQPLPIGQVNGHTLPIGGRINSGCGDVYWSEPPHWTRCSKMKIISWAIGDRLIQQSSCTIQTTFHGLCHHIVYSDVPRRGQNRGSDLSIMLIENRVGIKLGVENLAGLDHAWCLCSSAGHSAICFGRSPSPVAPRSVPAYLIMVKWQDVILHKVLMPNRQSGR